MFSSSVTKRTEELIKKKTEEKKKETKKAPAQKTPIKTEAERKYFVPSPLLENNKALEGTPAGEMQSVRERVFVPTKKADPLADFMKKKAEADKAAAEALAPKLSEQEAYRRRFVPQRTQTVPPKAQTASVPEKEIKAVAPDKTFTPFKIRENVRDYTARSTTEFEEMRKVQDEIKGLEDMLKVADGYEERIRVLEARKNNWQGRTRGLSSPWQGESELSSAIGEYEKWAEGNGIGKAGTIRKAISEKEAYKNEWHQRRFAENKQAEEDSVIERNGIDRDNFYYEDFEKWAEDHNYEKTADNELVPKHEGLRLGIYVGDDYYGTGKKLTTEQDEKDFEILKRLAMDNNAKRSAIEHPTATSVASVITAPGRAVVGGAAIVEDTVRKAQGKPIDVNSDFHKTGTRNAEQRQIIRDEYASKWFDGAELPVIGNVGAFLYDTVMSAGDAAANILVGNAFGAGSSAVSSFLMASDSAANQIVANKERGLSDEKALFLGIASGAVEMLTEKYSLDAIMKNPKTFVVGLLRSFGAEASEEISSNVINKGLDAAFAGDDAEIRLAIKEYENSGMSRKDAIIQAIFDSLTDDLRAGIAGGVSGMGMGGAYHGMQAAQLISTGKNIKKSGQLEQVISDGLDSAPESDAYKNASIIANEMTEGKTPTAYKVGQLAADVVAGKRQYGDKGTAKDTTASGVQYKITDIKGEKGDYGKGVLLDTDVFKDKHPREWNKTLTKYVYDNLAGAEVTVYDDSGNEEVISFAKSNERVWKDGAKNPHKVIDKLARAKGNINALSIVHIDELLQTAQKFDENEDHSHQWLDENGWEYKRAIVQSKDGGIYETTLNIAKAKDGRRILYALSNTKRIDAGVVSSIQTERDSHRTIDSNNRISQNEPVVNNNSMQNEAKIYGINKSTAAEQLKASRPKYYTVIDGISKRLKIKTVIDENIKGADGYYDRGTGELHISMNAKSPVREVFKHELTHALEGNQEYQDMVKFVKTTLKSEWDEKRAEIVDRYKRVNEQRAEEGQELLEMNDTDFDNETMAELAEKFQNDEFIEYVSKENPKMAERIWNWIREAMERIGGIFSSTREYSDWKIAKQKWNQMLKGAIGTEQSGEGVSFKIELDFKQQVDMALDGTLKSGFSVYAGKTPNLLQKCGLEDLPMLINQGHLQDINHEKSPDNIHYHGINRDIIKQIPELIKNPVMIYDSISENKENSVCIVTSKTDSDGLPIIISVRASSNQNNKYLDVSLETAKTENSNYITSMYGKNNFASHIEKVLDGDALLYANKSKTLKLFSDSELQLLTRLNNLGFDKIIHQSNNVVNTKTKEKVSLKLQEPESATLAEYIADIESENSALREANAILREGIETIKNIGVDPVKVNDLVSKIKKEYKSKIKTAEVAAKVQKELARLNNADTSNQEEFKRVYESVFAELSAVGTEIAENSQIKDTSLYDEYKSLRDRLRTTGFTLSDSAKSSIPDFNAFRKKYFGRMKIVNDASLEADSFYQALCEEYPEFFDADITNPADQVQRMAEVLDMLKPKVIDIDTESAGNAVAAELIASLTVDSALSDQTVIERVKAEYKQKANELKKKYQEGLEQYREERREREDREKLLKLAKEFQKIRTTPEFMEKIPELVSELDTMGISIIAKGYTRKDGTRVMDRLDLASLKEQYDKAKAEDPNFDPDKYVEAKINRLSLKQIADLEIDDVRNLLETLISLKHEIQTANRLINDQKRREIYAAGINVMEEVEASRGINTKDSSPREWLSYLGAKHNVASLTAERMMRRLVGYKEDSVLLELAKAISAGERKMMRFMQKSTEAFSEFAENAKEIEKISGKNAKVIEKVVAGQKVAYTPAMRIALYLHSLCPANMHHIRYGGIVFPDIKKYQNGKMSVAYSESGVRVKLMPTDVKMITDEMTDFERRLADAAFRWLNTDCRDALNETSLKLLGYEIARVNKYMPIVTSPDFLKSDPLIVDGTIEGMGILKERTRSAVPIHLVDIIKVIDAQKEQVGRYSGLAIPLRNFTRVMNVTETGQARSVKSVITRKWGEMSYKYIENLQKDLQKQRKKEPSAFDSLRSNYAGAVLSVNIKSAMKQTAGYPTAASTLGWKAIGKGMDPLFKTADEETINKYTPLLWYREQGYSMKEIGDYIAGRDGLEKKLPKLMGWLQAMDVWTAKMVWRASEAYVQYKTKLKKGTDEYYKKVAEVFNKAIEETQPNYTTMQQSDIQRSPNEILKSLLMFQSQARQNYNILYDAIGEFNAAQRSGDKAWKKKAAGNLGNAISSQVFQTLVTAAAGFAGAVLLGRTKRYEDDEDELSAKGVASGVMMDFLSSIASNALFGSEVFSLISALAGADGWYDIKASGVDMINDAASAVIKVGDIVSDDEKRKDFREYMTPVSNLIKKVAMLGGVPAENAGQLVNAVFEKALSAVEIAGGDTKWVEYQRMKISTPIREKSKYGAFLVDILREASELGDGAKKERLYETARDIAKDMEKSGISRDYIQSKLGSIMKDVYDGRKKMLGEDFARGPGWSFKESFYTNVINSEIDRLKEDKYTTEYSDSILTDLVSDSITYDGRVYTLSPEQAARYQDSVTKKVLSYNTRVIVDNEDIQTVFNGTAKYSGKMSKSAVTRVHDYLKKQVENENMTYAEAEDMWNKWGRGEIEMPVIDTYTEEYMTCSEMTLSQRRGLAEDKQKEVKDGKISYDDYMTWYNDFKDDKIKYKKRRYIYGSYADLDDTTKRKILTKIKNRARDEAQEEMKKEIVNG